MPPCPALSRLCRLLRRLVAVGLLAPTIVLAAVQVAWLEDPGGGLRIEQVADASLAGRFIAAEPEFVSFGLSTSAYWLRITLPAGEAPLLLEAHRRL